jgi:hypothetical protein
MRINYCLLSLVLLTFVINTGGAEQTSPGVVSSPQASTEDFPPNTWPPEPQHCITGSEQFEIFLQASWNNCAGRMNKRLREDYPVIVAHVMAGLILPSVWPAVMKEVYAELGKDGMYCTLTTIVEAAGGTQEAREDAKKAISSMLEIYDAAGDVSGAKDPIKHLQEFGRANIMKDPDRANAIVFFLKNVKEGVVDLPQDHAPTMINLIDKYLNSTERTTLRAISNAQDKMRECEFDAAKGIISMEMVQGLHWLTQFRAAILQQRKDISCSAQALDKYKQEHPPLTGFPDPMLRSYENEHTGLKDKLPKLVSQEQDQVKYLRQLKSQYKAIEDKAKELEMAQTHVEKLLKSAQNALDACDLTKVERELRSAQTELTGWCGIAMTKQFEARNALFEAMKEKQAQIVSDEKFINDGLKEATDLLQSHATCADVESKLQSVEKRLNNNNCVNGTQVSHTIAALRAEASNTATDELQKTLAVINGHIKNCDAVAATTMIAFARGIVAKRSCVPSGQGVPGMGEIEALETAKDDLNGARQKVLKAVADILPDAQRAGANCDVVRLQAFSEQLAIAAQEFSAFCKTPPPEVTNALNQIRDLMKVGHDKESAQKTTAVIQEGKNALKACDVMGVYASADQLEFIGKTCLVDGPLEAQNLRTAGDSIVKMQEALQQNVSAVLDQARKAWTPACDIASVRAAHSEINRIVEPYAMKCPEYPPGVSSDVSEVQKIFESADQQASAEREIKAKYDQARAAWKACKVADAIKLVDEMDKIQLPNEFCKSDRQLAGPFKADALFYGGHLEKMSNAIDTADQMLKSCPDNFQPIEQELTKAESHLNTLSTQMNSMACDLNVPRAAISELRTSMKQIGSSRKAIADKIGMADGLLKAASSNQQNLEKAEQYLKDAEALLQKAYPPECYEDLATNLDNVAGVIDLVADADEVVEEDPEVEDFDEEDFGDEENELDESSGVEEIPEDDSEGEVVTENKSVPPPVRREQPPASHFVGDFVGNQRTVETDAGPVNYGSLGTYIRITHKDGAWSLSIADMGFFAGLHENGNTYGKVSVEGNELRGENALSPGARQIVTIRINGDQLTGEYIIHFTTSGVKACPPCFNRTTFEAKRR